MGNEDVVVCKGACGSPKSASDVSIIDTLKDRFQNMGISSNTTDNEEKRLDLVHILPPESVDEIFQYLSSKDLASCAAVSIAWREAVNSNKVWAHLCNKKGWKDDFDPNFSHFIKAHRQFRKSYHSHDSFSPICQKHVLYNKHSSLQSHWRHGTCIKHKILNGPNSFLQLFEPVSCDGRYLVMLEKMSKQNVSLVVWSLDGIPFKLCELPLPNKMETVEAIAFDHSTVAVAQAWVIAIYHLKDGKFEMVHVKHDLKDLEPKTKLPKSMKQLNPYLKVTEDFVICVPNHSHSTVDFIPIFFFDRLTGDVKHKLSFESMYYMITNVVWFGDSCYLNLTNKKKKSYQIIEFNVKEAVWEAFCANVSVEVEQIAVSKQNVLAVTKSTNPAIREYFSPRSEHNNKTVWLWDRDTGSALKPFEAQGKSFQFVGDYLMYFDSSKVTVMNPKAPDMCSEFEVSGTISSIRASCHPSIMVIIKTGCYIEVWDWGLGTRLYTITAENGFGSQLWCDDKRIITYNQTSDNSLQTVTGGIMVLGFW